MYVSFSILRAVDAFIVQVIGLDILETVFYFYISHYFLQNLLFFFKFDAFFFFMW